MGPRILCPRIWHPRIRWPTDLEAHEFGGSLWSSCCLWPALGGLKHALQHFSIIFAELLKYEPGRGKSAPLKRISRSRESRALKHDVSMVRFFSKRVICVRLFGLGAVFHASRLTTPTSGEIDTDDGCRFMRMRISRRFAHKKHFNAAAPSLISSNAKAANQQTLTQSSFACLYPHLPYQQEIQLHGH